MARDDAGDGGLRNASAAGDLSGGDQGKGSNKDSSD